MGNPFPCFTLSTRPSGPAWRELNALVVAVGQRLPSASVATGAGASRTEPTDPSLGSRLLSDRDVTTSGE
jgi:hypothetical protein